MNILYIDHYAGSISMGMEFRPYYFAREWQKLGHRVRIVGADFSHLRKINPTVTSDFELQEIDGVEFQWIKTRRYEGNGLSRALTMFEFCTKLWLKAKTIAKEFKPDVVIASSTYPLDTFPAQRIKKQSKGFLVHEIHDMWPITPIELYGMSKYNPFVIAMQIGENSFCKHSDLVVSVLPNAEEYLKAHGLKDNRFVCIENGIVLEDWQCPEDLPNDFIEIISKAKSQGRVVFGFFGSHTKSYCIDNLIRAVSGINTDKLFLLFVGEGNYKNDLIALADELKLDKECYQFLPAINKKAMPSLLNMLDVSYIGAKKNRMFRFGIGMNKLFDAMMGGTPILYAVDAPNNLINQFHCGITVGAEDIEALRTGIIDMLNMPSEEREKMGSNGSLLARNNFTYAVLSSKFINEIKRRKKD